MGSLKYMHVQLPQIAPYWLLLSCATVNCSLTKHLQTAYCISTVRLKNIHLNEVEPHLYNPS